MFFHAVTLEQQFEKEKERIAPLLYRLQSITIYSNDLNCGFTYDGKNFITFARVDDAIAKSSTHPPNADALHMLMRTYRGPTTREEALQIGLDQLMLAYELLTRE